MRVDFSAKANEGLLRHLRDVAAAPAAVSAARTQPSCAPEAITDPYYKLGTHPDLVAWLWDEVTAKLPQICKWVVYGTPVLVHPDSGILFGFAGGTHTYALRLPAVERAAALAAGCKRTRQYPAYPQLNITASELRLDAIGEEWVFGQFLAVEKTWCLAAFEYAKPEG